MICEKGRDMTVRWVYSDEGVEKPSGGMSVELHASDINRVLLYSL